MDNTLFTITCTTCQAKLAVRDAAAVGQIVACPKCESMVLVAAPRGWTPPPTPTPVEEPASKRVPPADGLRDTVTDLPQPIPKQPPPLPMRLAPPTPGGPAGMETPPPVLVEAARPWWRNRGFMVGLAAVMLLLAGVWYSRQKSASKAVTEPAPTTEPPVVPPAVVKEKPPPLPAPLDPRWLPGNTKLVVQMQLSRLAAVPGAERLLTQVDTISRESLGPLMTGLGLTRAAVHRLTWASVDLAKWPEPGVCILELEPNQDARSLARTGEPAEFVVAGVACRTLSEGPWRHPFAILDEHTIVTGREALLRGLAAAAGPTLSPEGPLARLALASAVDPVFAVHLDLTAARAAKWRLPDAWLDVWPTIGPSWRGLWEQADGMSAAVCPAEKLTTEFVWTAAPGVKADPLAARLDAVRTAAATGLAARGAALAGKPNAAAEYAAFLERAAAALRGAKCTVAGAAVVCRAQWDRALTDALKLGLESQAPVVADWLAAASSADEAQHRRLGKAVSDYVKAQSQYPPAVAGSALVPPETRLSWIAALLPYLDQAEWHRQLAFEYSWDSPQNQPVAKRPLSAVINPLVGPGQSAAGYPVTHYVGVGGVGADAPRLPASHPRAGVFGYGRATLPQDIADGASNTIAVLGATGRIGPWAAGGDASVRPLTKAPYFQGPDGFGSGQPSGMFAGMADGAVRFLSKDVDPKIVEQLATIHGGEKPDVAAIWPPPKPTPQPAAKPAPPPVPPPPKTEEMMPDVAPDDQDAEVDVETRLAGEMHALELDNTPLLQFVRLMSDLSGLPLTIDLDACVRKGVRLDAPVRTKLNQTTVREALETVAASRGLALVVRNNQAILTCPAAESEALRVERYDVSDLATGATNPAVLMQWTQELVAPGAWKPAGQGRIEAAGSVLSITQTEAVHAETLRFFERLRAARGLPLASRGDPQRFAILPAWRRAETALAQPVTFNFQPTRPLPRILLPLEEACRVTLAVDWAALAAAKVSAQVKGGVAVDKQPLRVTLDKLLAPLGLAYRTVDANLLEITSRKALAERLELEFYPVGPLVAAGRAVETLVEQLRTQVEKSSWSGNGGRGVVRFDAASKHLLVLQSQPMQAAAARLLAASSSKPPAQPSASPQPK